MSRAESRMGHASTVALVDGSCYADDGDVDLRFPDAGLWPPFPRRLRKWLYGLSAPWRYDLIVYEFASSIVDFHRPGLDLLDLRLARHGRGVVAAVFHGCDVRAANGVCDFCPTPCDPARARRRLDIVRAAADLLYVKTPDLLRVVPEATYLPQAVLDPSRVQQEPPRMDGPLRLVHGPSAPLLKGTRHVIRAVDQLQREGVDIELNLVHNVPHVEALQAYRDSDLAVDQLLAGWYGVFAVELMAMGKPVVCRIDQSALAASGLAGVPLIDASPDSLVDVLRELAGKRQLLRELGERSRDYVLENHDAARLAARVVRDYESVSGVRAD